jgi:hypothetical protein
MNLRRLISDMASPTPPEGVGVDWEKKALKEKELSHQLSGEPEMRFVSTALVMMAIALILIALMLLTPTVHANPTTW